MRYINKAEIHTQAVKILRNSKNNMKKTANRLASCNVDNQIDAILKQIKKECWQLEDHIIIQGCANRLVIEFCQAEINFQK